MKKILSTVLALVMLVSMFAVFAVSSAAAEPETYNGSALSNYRNELLNAKFGDFAWLDAYGARSYAGYDDTIWGLICDDIDKIDAIKNSQTWNGNQYSNKDAEGRAAIQLMKAHLATLTSGLIVYSTNDLNTLRNYMLCAMWGGDVSDYTTWVWLPAYSAHHFDGYDDSRWAAVCADIDWFDANRRTCTEDEGKAAIIDLSRDMGNCYMPAAITYTFDTVLDSADPYYAIAVAEKANLLQAGGTYVQVGPATGNTASHYFAYYYNYYYQRVTLPENQANETAIAYKALLDNVYAALQSEDIIYGYKGIADTLEATWQTMRAAIAISNGLTAKRNAYMNAYDEAHDAATTGNSLNSNSLGYWTADSWATYWAAVEAVDAQRPSGTDAQSNAAYDAFVAAAVALVPSGTSFDPVNKGAYDALMAQLAGKSLYQWYVDRWFDYFAGTTSTDENVVLFGEQADELDLQMLEDYSDDYDYTAWFIDGDKTKDMITEASWMAAREAIGVSEGSRYAKLYALQAEVGDASLYTEESYQIIVDAAANWDSYAGLQKYTICDNLVAGFVDAYPYLEVIPTANATYNYYARQVAKLDGVACEFVDNFNALSIEGLASDFDAAVKALAPSFAAARKANPFGSEFQKAVAKLATQYAGVASVADLCTAADVTRLANYGTVAECAAYMAQINAAIEALDDATVAILTAKAAIFGNSDRGTFVVNYKTAYNSYKDLVTLDANKGAEYNRYCELLADYNAAFTSELLTVEEYEAMRVELEHAWWAMRAAAGVGLVFQRALAKAATAETATAAQQDYVNGLAVAIYSTYTDAQVAEVWAAFNALAA